MLSCQFHIPARRGNCIAPIRRTASALGFHKLLVPVAARARIQGSPGSAGPKRCLLAHCVRLVGHRHREQSRNPEPGKVGPCQSAHGQLQLEARITFASHARFRVNKRSSSTSCSSGSTSNVHVQIWSDRDRRVFSRGLASVVDRFGAVVQKLASISLRQMPTRRGEAR